MKYIFLILSIFFICIQQSNAGVFDLPPSQGNHIKIDHIIDRGRFAEAVYKGRKIGMFYCNVGYSEGYIEIYGHGASPYFSFNNEQECKKTIFLIKSAENHQGTVEIVLGKTQEMSRHGPNIVTQVNI